MNGDVNSVDGNGLWSRQFLMYMASMLTWKGWLFYAVYMQVGDGVLMAAIGGATAVESSLGVMRAWHDKHVKTANGNGHAPVEATDET
jgi:hypothetical protein